MPTFDSSSPGSIVVPAADEERALERPKSATRAPVTYLGLAGFVVALLVVHRLQVSPVLEILLILGLTAAPMLFVDFLFLKVHRRASTGLDWRRAPDFSVWRATVKTLGLMATLSVLGAVYWVFPEYHDKSYAIVYELLNTTWPYAAILLPIYIFLVDAYMVDPNDGYWQAGCIVIGRVSQVDRNIFGQYCLGWLVKGFFIPFMMSTFLPNIDAVYASAFLKGGGGFRPFYEFGYQLLYTIDITFGTLGYLLTLRVADTHLRSVESTAFGWLVALVCYPPFWPQLYDRFWPYDAHAVYWGPWLTSTPVLYWLWGMLILCSLVVYAWATVIFGCRFSNLTHRGILTNGPYRWTKHPAYLSKNLSWWLITVPFISNADIWDCARACLMLGAVNCIYFLRAKTEERHLSRDPTYVAYALWINENGTLKWLGKAAPMLRYKRPADPTLQGRARLPLHQEDRGDTAGERARP